MCRLPSCFSLTSTSFIDPLKIQQWLEGLSATVRAQAPQRQGAGELLEVLGVPGERVACYPRCQGKGTATTPPHKPLPCPPPSPGSEGPQAPGPLLVHLFQLLPQGTPLPRLVLCGAKR